jgi:lipopolysaccharide export system permease protein
VDFIENMRRGASNPHQTLWMSMLLAFYNAPGFSERAMPFAILFGSIATLILLNRKLELVIARAAGVSAWQFLLPICICAALLGILSSTVYNPMSVKFNQKSKALKTELLIANGKKQTNQKQAFWISDDGGAKGGSVISATAAQNEGKDLTNAVFIYFHNDGTINYRIDALRAKFKSLKSIDGQNKKNIWELTNATQFKVGKPSIQNASMTVETSLSEQNLQENASQPSELHFWQLPTYIENNKVTNFKIHTFSVHYQTLLLRPALFIAMVLIAATVSLKFVRFGQIGRMILVGITCGFALFILSELILAFGNNGIISPFASAWTPTIIAILCGSTFLLYQEDG